MIFIVSNDVDVSTNNVIKYLRLYKIPFLRLTESNFIECLNIKISNTQFEFEFIVNSKKYLFSDIESFWFRKNDLELFKKFTLKSDLKNEYNEINDYLLSSEILALKEYLIFLLETKTFLGNINMGDGNKLISFMLAKEVGFIIPETHVSSSLNYLINNYEDKIIKPIEDSFMLLKNNSWFYTKYELLNKKSFEKKTLKIFPSCIQEYVNKKIEIRVFYIHGKCYSMAIFSQLDESTKVDFRNYNFDKLNRMVPFNLPLSINNKVIKFMKRMGLNTGSIDLILNNDNEYVFLEVNPVGQYGMVQYYCNYNLDSLIFNFLTNEKQSTPYF